MRARALRYAAIAAACAVVGLTTVSISAATPAPASRPAAAVAAPQPDSTMPAGTPAPIPSPSQTTILPSASPAPATSPQSLVSPAPNENVAVRTSDCTATSGNPYLAPLWKVQVNDGESLFAFANAHAPGELAGILGDTYMCGPGWQQLSFAIYLSGEKYNAPLPVGTILWNLDYTP